MQKRRGGVRAPRVPKVEREEDEEKDDSIVLLPSTNPKWSIEVYGGRDGLFKGYMGRLKTDGAEVSDSPRVLLRTFPKRC